MGPEYLVLTIGLYIFLHILEGYALLPLIQWHTVLLPPALTLVVQVLLGELLGVLGLLVAAPLTVVRAATPIRLAFVTGGEVNQIGGNIWQGETMAGQPIETFTLRSGARSYTTSQLKSGGRYYIAVTIVGVQTRV